jgi:hypothetical protein
MFISTLKEGIMQKLIAVVTFVLLYVLAFLAGSAEKVRVIGGDTEFAAAWVSGGDVEVWVVNPYFLALAVVSAVVIWKVRR